MKKRLAALANRRSTLVEKIEIQRLDLADIFLDLQKPLTLADRGLKAVRLMRNHPGWVAGGFAALLSLRGKGIAGMARKGWRLMYLYPAIFSFGLKFLYTAYRSPGADQPEERDPEIDHSQY